MEIKELVEKVRSKWEEIFIQEEENIRNIFLSNLEVSISMGISLEVISIDIKKNLLLLKGAAPGANNSIVRITK